MGNVVEQGVNKGITIHGTHHARVDRNVVFDVRGVSIYVEDGNEMNNTISYNALLCPTRSNGAERGVGTGFDGQGYRCKLEGVPEHADSDFLEQSAIYALSASNHFVGNRVSGHVISPRVQPRVTMPADSGDSAARLNPSRGRRTPSTSTDRATASGALAQRVGARAS